MHSTVSCLSILELIDMVGIVRLILTIQNVMKEDLKLGNILLENTLMKMEFFLKDPPPMFLRAYYLRGALTLRGIYLRYLKPAVLLSSQFNLTSLS